MEDSPDPQAGAAPGSPSGAGAALLGLLGTRIELLGIELREEGLQLQRLLVLGIVAAFLLGGALVLVGVLVAAMFWDSHRLLALAAVTVLYAVIGTVVLLRLRSSALSRPLPFDATVRELQADLRALRQPAGGPTP